MKVTWTNTFTADFNLDQAEEDFRFIMEQNPEEPDKAIYDAVEANWACDWAIEEYADTSSAIEQCAKALRERIGGVQMSMESLPSFPILWWEENSVWKNNGNTYINFTSSGNDDRSNTWKG